MSKQIIPLVADDISQFSRSLTKQILQKDAPLTHVRMLNMLAKANGFRNFQHMRAAHKSRERLDDVQTSAVDFKLVERCLNQFDEQGVLMRWPSKNLVQKTCIWVFWAMLPKGQNLTERQISALLDEGHSFGDPATLRRVMVGYQLVSRTKDGAQYQRIEQTPPPEAIELIARVKARRQE